MREDKLYKAGPSCETWQDCTVYNESVCYSYTKLCDSYNEAEIYDTFHTFLLSNSTINFPNLGIKLLNEIKFKLDYGT